MTANIAEAKSIEEVTEKLQSAADEVNSSTKRWQIKLNEGKSVHVHFTSRKINYLPMCQPTSDST